MQYQLIHKNTPALDVISSERQSWTIYVSFSSVVWLMLWFNINTGPYTLKYYPTTWMEWFHYIRTAFPLMILFLLFLIPTLKSADQLHRMTLCETFWIIYGITGLIASLYSPRPMDAAYWALAYLSIFVARRVYIQGQDSLVKARQLNYFNWFVTTVFLIILTVSARDLLFSEETLLQGQTVYATISDVRTIGGMTAPISSGMARFAAVPGIISFLLILQSRGAKRYLSIGFFIYAGFLIYLMQSRGAIFAYGFALSFVLLFYSCRTRLFGLTFLVIFALTLFTNVIPESVIHGVTDYLYRGQSEEEFVTFTGRTFAWKLAWNEVHDYPILGQGFHSDHYLLGLNIHNTYMYTLMSAGYIGAVAFIIGVATAWYMLLYNLKSSAAEQLGHRVFLLQVGGILAFFTVRSIPEVSGAIVGIDTMIMLSAITYIGILYRYQRQLAYQERIQQNKAVVKYKIRWQRSS